MRHFKIQCSLLLWVVCTATGLRAQPVKQVMDSPDGNFRIEISQKQVKPGKKQLYYQVHYKNKPIILESELGVLVENNLFESALAIENDSSHLWFENLNYLSADRKSQNENWKPVYGERSLIKDHYNELVLKFEKFGSGNAQAEGHAGVMKCI
jgi:alpha-glucosidase